MHAGCRKGIEGDPLRCVDRGILVAQSIGVFLFTLVVVGLTGIIAVYLRSARAVAAVSANRGFGCRGFERYVGEVFGSLGGLGGLVRRGCIGRRCRGIFCNADVTAGLCCRRRGAGVWRCLCGVLVGGSLRHDVGTRARAFAHGFLACFLKDPRNRGLQRVDLSKRIHVLIRSRLRGRCVGLRLLGKLCRCLNRGNGFKNSLVCIDRRMMNAGGCQRVNRYAFRRIDGAIAVADGAGAFGLLFLFVGFFEFVGKVGCHRFIPCL